MLCSGKVLAFKTVQSSAGEGGNVQGATQGTGQWTYWKDTGAWIGTQVEQTDSSTAEACTRACNTDKNCAAVAMDVGTNNVDITKCVLIRGSGETENTKRTLVKAALGANYTLATAAAWS